jgi:diguanylate cyclase (GGDEF)-like protein/PAS domain S-box-containing protein
LTAISELAASVALLFAVLVGLVATVAAFAYRRKLSEAREQLLRDDELVEHLQEGIYRSSPDGRQLKSNPALVKLNGYETEAEQLAGVKDIATEWYVDPKRRAQFQEILHRDGRVEDFVSEIYRHKTRERIWITESARLVLDRKTGKPKYYEGSVREITETVRRLQLEEGFRKLTNQVPGGLIQFSLMPDQSVRSLFLNPGWERITELDREAQLRNPSTFRDCIDPADRARFEKTLSESGETLTPWSIEFRFHTPSGNMKWLNVAAQPERDGDSIVYHAYLSDISERKRQEMEIAKLAYFDPLTQLPNRRYLLDRLADVVGQAADQNTHGALLFIDLDKFKTLNDNEGHAAGDAYLVEVARRLRDTVDESAIVARIGGDEFVVLLPNAGSSRDAAEASAGTAAERTLKSIRTGFLSGGTRHIGGASIGIVTFDGSQRHPAEILKCADIAMYEAKLSDYRSISIFDADKSRLDSRRYRLAKDFPRALELRELELHLQPQIDSQGVLVGAEGLIRWNHPELGLLSPGSFLAIVEQFNLGPDFDRTILDLGTRLLAGWAKNERLSKLRLALNVSVESLGSDDFVPLVHGLVAKNAIDPTRLTFEVTEHVMAKDHERVAAHMRALKNLGVRLSLDDFGTGYSSLAYLKRLPFDEVKIDGSFVTDIESDANGRALVKTIIAMAQTLELESVAEHVENAAQEEFLRSLGCNIFQGHLYSEAVTRARFEALVGVDGSKRRVSDVAAPRRQAG